jgi:hypothetical protein
MNTHLSQHIDKITRDLMRADAQQTERAICAVLAGHYGPGILARAPQQIFDQLGADDLVLFKRIQPLGTGEPDEIVLMHGPETKIGERLDESRVISRMPLPRLFPRRPSCPEPL